MEGRCVICGLVGYAGSFNRNREKVFDTLLRVDVIRGPHSTGVAFINSEKDWMTLKNTVLPDELMASKDYKEMDRMQWLIKMGHNRFATRGKIDNDNAHPHNEGKIIGTHNGTLYGQHRLPDEKEYVSDSANLFHSIDKIGIVETWKLIDGGCAAVWWDANDGTLNMITNDERPLFFSLTEDKKGMFWVSEPWMLRGAAGRHDVNLQKVMKPKKDCLFKFSINKGKEIEYAASTLKGYESPIWKSSNYNHGYSGPWSATPYKKPPALTKAELKRIRKEEKRKNRPVERRHPEDSIEGFDGEWITKEVFNQVYKECVFCCEPIFFEEEGISFLDRHSAACFHCTHIAEGYGVDMKSAKS